MKEQRKSLEIYLKQAPGLKAKLASSEWQDVIRVDTVTTQSKKPQVKIFQKLILGRW